MTNNIKQAIIIGGGPAGVSAALYLARAGQKVCIIENGPGALAKAHKIDNYYGIAASGAKLYAAGLEQARSLGVEILQDEVLGVEYTDCFTLSLKNTAEQLQTEALVLATGSKNITLNLPGLIELEGKGISYCAVCDGFFFRKKRVAVLGNGAYALHEAAYLRQLAGSVTILTNGQSGDAAKAAGFEVNTSVLQAVEAQQHPLYRRQHAGRRRLVHRSWHSRQHRYGAQARRRAEWTLHPYRRRRSNQYPRTFRCRRLHGRLDAGGQGSTRGCTRRPDSVKVFAPA